MGTFSQCCVHSAARVPCSKAQERRIADASINVAAHVDRQACPPADKGRPLAAAQLLPDMEVDLKTALPGGMLRCQGSLPSSLQLH